MLYSFFCLCALGLGQMTQFGPKKYDLVKQEQDGQADKGGRVFQAEKKHGRRAGVCRQKLDVYVSQS